MICPECNEESTGKVGYCDLCNRRIVKRSGRKVLYKILDFFRFHKHEWKLLDSGNIKTNHGTFTMAIYKCTKCSARDWYVSGFIEEVEKWERHHGVVKE